MILAISLILISLFTLHLLCEKSNGTNQRVLAYQSTNAGALPTTALPVRPVLASTSTVKNKQPLKQHGFSYSATNRIEELSADWEKAAPTGNLFLQRPYLEAIEHNPPQGIRFSYLVFYHQDVPVGVAYCQVTNFSVDSSIQSQGEEKTDKYPCLVRAFGRFLKNILVGKNHNLLVCGNLLLTGEHGFYFSDSLDKQLAFDLLEDGLIQLQGNWQQQKVNIDGILIKDLEEQHRPHGQTLVKRKFSEFTFHPNMVLTIPETWKTFDDYLAAIASKYRVRAKRAFRLGESIVKRELDTEQILAQKGRLFELFNAVVNTQDFNMVNIDENYVPTLKTHLGDRFRVFGYFIDDNLIGYYTTIMNHNEVEAHFLGFDQSYNKECQIYLNMLFDILRFGIQERAHKVVYARTAMEIKSSIGAEAFDMYCYIRANNRLTNSILQPVVEHLTPPADWLPRNPFKETTG